MGIEFTQKQGLNHQKYCNEFDNYQWDVPFSRRMKMQNQVNAPDLQAGRGIANWEQITAQTHKRSVKTIKLELWFVAKVRTACDVFGRAKERAVKIEGDRMTILEKEDEMDKQEALKTEE